MSLVLASAGVLSPPANKAAAKSETLPNLIMPRVTEYHSKCLSLAKGDLFLRIVRSFFIGFFVDGR
ncbi:hypothetical protein, partial [Pseudoalteromonas sp. SYSU M81241]